VSRSDEPAASRLVFLGCRVSGLTGGILIPKAAPELGGVHTRGLHVSINIAAEAYPPMAWQAHPAINIAAEAYLPMAWEAHPTINIAPKAYTPMAWQAHPAINIAPKGRY
jgi:hypothetical protein